MYRHGLRTQVIERSSTSHMNDVIDIAMSTSAAISPAVTIGGGIVNWDRVITETILGMLVLVGAHFNMIIM